MNADEVIKEYKRRILEGDDIRATFHWYKAQLDALEKGSADHVKLWHWMDGNVFAWRQDTKEFEKAVSMGLGQQMPAMVQASMALPTYDGPVPKRTTITMDVDVLVDLTKPRPESKTQVVKTIFACDDCPFHTNHVDVMEEHQKTPDLRHRIKRLLAPVAQLRPKQAFSISLGGFVMASAAFVSSLLGYETITFILLVPAAFCLLISVYCVWERRKTMKKVPKR